MALADQPRSGDGATPGMDSEHIPHVRMIGISKAFGSTVANDGVNLDLAPGEIHALLGENGAGKTTLMNVLFGMIKPDAGRILLDEEEVSFENPGDALARGIGMVHQHFMLVQDFTVAENVVLGTMSPWNMSFKPRKVRRDVKAAGERLGVTIDPRRRVSELPIETQQRVEIFKLLYRGARILILDEPTSSLGPLQIADLLETLKGLRARGHSIVIVTHKLAEVMQVADRVTILRSGRNVASVERGKFDERSLARMMTGRELPELPPVELVQSDADPPAYRVRELVVHGHDRLHAVHGLSFDVHAGEILGVAGVEGNGQRELADALCGVTHIESGQVLLEGEEVTSSSPLRLRSLGVRGIPEDRQGWGLVLDMTVGENLALSDVPLRRLSQFGFLNPRSIRERAREVLEEYDVRPAEPDIPVMSLSGGNQQKVVLARELSCDPRVLIAANPTQGLDVGAAEYVRRRLLGVRAQRKAIVLISSDLDELLALSDRIIVLYRGKIAYRAIARDVSMDVLSLAMAGKAEKPDAPAAAGVAADSGSA